MDAMDCWRLCDELTIVQATLLILGMDPGDGTADYVMGWEDHARPEGFNAIHAALTSAVNSTNLKARIVHTGEYVEWRNQDGDPHSDWVREELPDWKKTTIDVNDLKKWLLSRNLKPSFFFPQGTEERDYLDPNNQYYAPKLAAAVKAWETVTGDPQLLNRKTPKQALEKWLREHATDYGLTKEDGTHNIQGIDQIAKVANWKPEGGATKTPVAAVDTPHPPLEAPANNDFPPEDDPESEIPF